MSSKTFDSLAAGRTAKRRCLIENETALALGIALVERSYCFPLSSLAEPDDGFEDGGENSMIPVCPARRLAEEGKDGDSENYLKASFRLGSERPEGQSLASRDVDAEA